MSRRQAVRGAQRPVYVVQQRQSNPAGGLGLASIIVGVFATFLCWVPFVNLALYAVAFVLAVIGIMVAIFTNRGLGMPFVGLLISTLPVAVIFVVMGGLAALVGGAGATQPTDPPRPSPPATAPATSPGTTDPPPAAEDAPEEPSRAASVSMRSVEEPMAIPSGDSYDMIVAANAGREIPDLLDGPEPQVGRLVRIGGSAHVISLIDDSQILVELSNGSAEVDCILWTDGPAFSEMLSDRSYSLEDWYGLATGPVKYETLFGETRRVQSFQLLDKGRLDAAMHRERQRRAAIAWANYDRDLAEYLRGVREANDAIREAEAALADADADNAVLARWLELDAELRMYQGAAGSRTAAADKARSIRREIDELGDVDLRAAFAYRDHRNELIEAIRAAEAEKRATSEGRPESPPMARPDT